MRGEPWPRHRNGSRPGTFERNQRDENDRINDQARREAQLFAALNAVERGVADEAARRADLVHHRVAGIHAGGAVDAFHLGAVADVDAGGADRHALVAGHAIAEAGMAALAEFSVAREAGRAFRRACGRRRRRCEFSSSNSDCSRPYGQMNVQACSRNRAKMP